MAVEVSYPISRELRERAEQGDAAAWNQLGEHTLRFAPPELESLPYADWSSRQLKSQVTGLNYIIVQDYQAVQNYPGRDFLEVWSDHTSHAGGDLALVRLALEAREKPEEDHIGKWNARRRRDIEQAFQFFLEAAMLGDPEGFWNLGWRYYIGEGVERSELAAISCWQSAANCGHAESAERLKEILPADLHFCF